MSPSTALAHRPYRGLTDDWITPPEIVAALGTFDLDPCACTPQPWPLARHSFAVGDDGLSQPWAGRVWLNPPYGAATGIWLRRLVEHGNGIALVQARVETRWFHEQVWREASGILFLRGRPTFFRPDGTRASGNSGGPCVLVAYGRANYSALLHSGLPGSLVQFWRETRLALDADEAPTP